ncbi:tripartite tricarboxylate transporter substrate binding protein [Pigmentiphaga soli]|uniref:Tripartite tricarboxylate transporter substrate binding protein n=1 Tax=Pigmentiphaga soli TaxID=1007095 RepID=A0ABP8GBR4_9BURK
MIARYFAALVFLGTIAPAYSAPYPDKQVRIIVPYTAGGSVDLVAREIAHRLKDELGQTFIVENRAGASANIGANFVAKSDPDGYTLLATAATTLAAAPSMFKNLPYDPRKDLSAVAMVAAQPNVLVVHPSLPVTTVQQFIDLARSKPGEINYAIAAVGGPQHMAGEMFMASTKTRLNRVPYKGGANAITDLVGGQVDAMFAVLPEALPFIKSGGLRPVAVTTRERTELLPDVPSMQEAGLAGYELIGWIGLAAPSKTPPEVVERLNGAIQKLLGTDSFKQWLYGVGLEPMGGSVDTVRKFVDGEVDKYRRLVEQAGIEPM